MVLEMMTNIRRSVITQIDFGNWLAVDQEMCGVVFCSDAAPIGVIS